ncbi:MAG: hypothetical protein ACP5US_01900 [Candidatus Kryptoniota bacterium]
MGDNKYGDYVVVFKTYLQTSIINAKMNLEARGIKYITRNETFAGIYPNLDGMSTVEFFVRKEDEEDAKDALRDLIEGEK